MASGSAAAEADQKMERRGSLGRAFSKVKGLMKRRDSTGGSGSGRKPSAPTTSTPLASTKEEGKPAAEEDESANAGDKLEVEEPTAEEIAEIEGPFDENKIRALLQGTGLDYHPTSAARGKTAPVGRPRHVERPVRMRVHWSCHECNGSFAADKKCIQCGHGRCSECKRTPVKKTADKTEKADKTAKTDKADKTEKTDKADKTGKGSQRVAEKPSTSGAAVAGAAAGAGVAAGAGAAPVAAKPDEEDVGDDQALKQYEQKFQQRPTQGINLLPQSEQRGEGPSLPPEQPKLVASVQRVYKKPRQRVRWSCDQCHQTFSDLEKCRNCGHPRCRDCTRSPIKRRDNTDPAILESVNQRLANLNTGPGADSRQSVAAAG